MKHTDQAPFAHGCGEPQVRVNDVVQLSPEHPHTECFKGCFLLVTELKSWGVMGFVAMMNEISERAGCAYYRAPHGSYERIGTAVWAPPPEDSDDE